MVGRPLSWLIIGLKLCAVSWAVEIRTYSATRHDRFTNFTSTPVFNDSAWYGSRKYSGVGWIPGESNGRQFALVSPRHLVFATHFYPGNGTVIRFLNANGVTVDRTIVGTQIVPNTDSQASDLCLISLSSPITESEKVAHFPYLNLSSETAYVGTTFTTFGWSMKAGRGSILSFEDSPEGMNPTRLMAFRYRKLFGNQDDAYVVVGDSGSPTFATANGSPAILGTHSAAGEETLYYYGYDAFIPHYIGALDLLMKPDGYRMVPAYPPAVSLSASLVVTTPLKQGYAGSCRFDLSNTGANDGGNAKLKLHFPLGVGPGSVTATGWIAEMSGPQDWVFRKANIAVDETSQFTASWSEVPMVNSISVDVSRVADGSPAALQTFELQPIQTFKAWASNLPDPSINGDPDADGVSNLLEYAFGGNGAVSSQRSESGGWLLPQISRDQSTISIQFPVREDAAQRGLSYVPEFSTDLSSGSWNAVSAPVTDVSSPFDPPVAGFLMRTVTWNRTETKQFVRVRISLTE